MRKDALAITVSTLVMGSFGTFLRWLQDRTVFDAETGLANAGSAISVIYVIYSLLAAAGIAGITFFWLRRLEPPADAGEALRTSTPFSTALSWAMAAVFVAAGVLGMFSASGSRYPQLHRVFGALTAVAGACFPFLTHRGEGGKRLGGRLPASLLTVFYCCWLAMAYVDHEQNPVRWAYAPEILAVVGGVLAFYYLTGWFYRCPRPFHTLFFVQLGAFLNICTLPDTRGTAGTAAFAATAVMLLMLEYVLIENMKPERGEGHGTL